MPASTIPPDGPPSAQLAVACDARWIDREERRGHPFVEGSYRRQPCAGRVLGVTSPGPLREGKREPSGETHELGDRAGPHLLHHLCAVRLDGALGRADVAGDLLVEPAGHDYPVPLMQVSRCVRLKAKADGEAR